MKYLSLFLVFATMIVMSSCMSTTELTDSVTHLENRSGEISKILVVGVSENRSVRNRYEKEMKAQIERLGIRAMGSLEAMPGDEKIEREAFDKYFKAQQIDAILVSSVISTEKVGMTGGGEEYSTTYRPNNYWVTYDRTYDRVADPGHAEYANIVRVESNLFDVKTEDLIWQCHSKSFNKENTENVISDLAKLLGKALKQDGVIK